jgi:hypothetical protein
MDIVFQPSGNFDEVYLYEELMEADLHAIVSPIVFALMKAKLIFPRSGQANRLQTPISNPSSIKRSVG